MDTITTDKDTGSVQRRQIGFTYSEEYNDIIVAIGGIHTNIKCSDINVLLREGMKVLDVGQLSTRRCPKKPLYRMKMDKGSIKHNQVSRPVSVG